MQCNHAVQGQDVCLPCKRRYEKTRLRLTLAARKPRPLRTLKAIQSKIAKLPIEMQLTLVEALLDSLPQATELVKARARKLLGG